MEAGTLMKFLAISQIAPQGDGQELTLREDANILYSLLDSGEILSQYWKADDSGSVLIFEADSLMSAEELLSSLPSVQQGVQLFNLTEIMPVWERSGEGNGKRN